MANESMLATISALLIKLATSFRLTPQSSCDAITIMANELLALPFPTLNAWMGSIVAPCQRQPVLRQHVGWFLPDAAIIIEDED
ncbi:hypothetical protein B0H12DRAFT_840359 [Mycena haematopus]|nr:hypothetical protein B0H12DRAFT_840359 [Mycena haematopus]